jgi:hypothetical protein
MQAGRGERKVHHASGKKGRQEQKKKEKEKQKHNRDQT